MTEFELDGFRFLLQDFFDKDHAKNFMVHMLVDDAQAWYQKFKEAIDSKVFVDVTITAPERQPWGILTAYMTDPTGVLWHIAEKPEK